MQRKQRAKHRTEWKRVVGFTIERETRERLEALADERGQTLSALVRDFVEEMLRQQEKRPEIRQNGQWQDQWPERSQHALV